MSPMGDLPITDYTINNPASIECPYCHQTWQLDDQSCGEISDYPEGQTTLCTRCERELVIKVSYDIIVQAWKPEALK
jgi:hypothetical protein